MICQILRFNFCWTYCVWIWQSILHGWQETLMVRFCRGRWRQFPEAGIGIHWTSVEGSRKVIAVNHPLDLATRSHSWLRLSSGEQGAFWEMHVGLNRQWGKARGLCVFTNQTTCFQQRPHLLFHPCKWKPKGFNEMLHSELVNQRGFWGTQSRESWHTHPVDGGITSTVVSRAWKGAESIAFLTGGFPRLQTEASCPDSWYLKASA